MTEIPNKIWRKMSQKEQYETVANAIAGFHYYDYAGNVTVMMSMAGFKRIEDFNKKMIDKYSKTKKKMKKTTDQHKLKSKGQTPVKAAAEAKKDKFKFPKTKLK